MNEIVLGGIARAIKTALLHLDEQINPEFIKKNDIQPIFEIRLELEDDIIYDPPIEEKGAISVRGSVRSWINDFF